VYAKTLRHYEYNVNIPDSENRPVICFLRLLNLFLEKLLKTLVDKSFTVVHSFRTARRR
jgi:hypothetical protein